jgi:beta-ribofuranosylaminobenzene 5'-phosphate synthase
LNLDSFGIINLLMEKSAEVSVLDKSLAEVCVHAESTARLHMGFFDLNGGLGRKFGSIGLSIDAPAIVLNAYFAEKVLIVGESTVPSAVLERARMLAQNFMQKLGIKTGVELDIKQHIPEHAGLGSGTQMALVIGAAISQIYGLGLSTKEISVLTGRGGRSGIGIAAFDEGGLLIDGGRTMDAKESHIPPLLARYDFPTDWKILLIFDKSFRGVHGKAELEAFNKLPVFSENLAAQLCRHVLMQGMPALVERDLNVFGKCIQVLQSHVGDYFSPAQGGRYASGLVAKVLKHVEKEGVACFGQSSWGPTGFAVFENLVTAEKCLESLKLTFDDSALEWQICSARNHGAIIT